MDTTAARWVNVVVGVWLFLSAFFWPHAASQYTNTWLMGIITVAVALIALGAPAFRYVNTVVGAWLIISAFVLPSISAGTRWNNVIVGVVVAFVSLAGTSSSNTAFRQTRTA